MRVLITENGKNGNVTVNLPGRVADRIRATRRGGGFWFVISATNEYWYTRPKRIKTGM